MTYAIVNCNIDFPPFEENILMDGDGDWEYPTCIYEGAIVKINRCLYNGGKVMVQVLKQGTSIEFSRGELAETERNGGFVELKHLTLVVGFDMIKLCKRLDYVDSLTVDELLALLTEQVDLIA